MSAAGDPGGPLDELVDVEAASQILEVPVEQVLAMVDQGMLTPEHGAAGPRFQRAELLAAREAGG